MKKLATAVLCALTLTACTPGAPVQSPESSETPSTVSPSPVPSPNPSPEPSESPSPEPSPTVESPSPSPTVSMSPEQEAAAETVFEYFRIMDATKGDVKADLQPLADITDGNMRRMAMDIIRQARQRGLQQEGSARHEVTNVSEPRVEDGEMKMVVTACADATSIRTIDVSSGEPVDKSRIIPFITYTFTVAKRHMWVVVDGRNQRADSCP